MTIQSAVLKQSQSASHIVGALTLIYPYCSLMLSDSYTLWTTHSLVVYIAQILSCILMLYQFYHLLTSLKPLSKVQPELQLKVITLSFLQVNLLSKLANNGKLTSNEYKKRVDNNLCIYYKTEDYKLDFCSKKQILITSKSYSIRATEQKSRTLQIFRKL